VGQNPEEKSSSSCVGSITLCNEIKKRNCPFLIIPVFWSEATFAGKRRSPHKIINFGFSQNVFLHEVGKPISSVEGNLLKGLVNSLLVKSKAVNPNAAPR
jgi:hypothetical protein